MTDGQFIGLIVAIALSSLWVIISVYESACNLADTIIHWLDERDEDK